MNTNEKYMLYAIDLAKKAWGKTSPNPLVGAVLVKSNEIIGEGFHHKAGEPHAEINALNNTKISTKDAVLYVTLEPCSTFGQTPPCTSAIINANLAKVVIGSLDPNPAHAGNGIKILNQANIETVVGIKEKECKKLNEAFFKWITHKKPFVILKMAMTLDGKIATVTGQSKWITGEVARNRVQRLRQWSDAIMIGGETARKDSPSLTVREPKNWEKQPRRIILSNSISTENITKLMGKGSVPPELISLKTKDDFKKYLMQLGKENVISLLIEGGGELADFALKSDVVDKIEFHIAPKILGGRDSRPVVGGLNPNNLQEALNLVDINTEMLGNDILITGYCK